MLVDALRREPPAVEWVLHPLLGEQPAMIDAMAAFAASLVDRALP